jgi:hypothetical protein
MNELLNVKVDAKDKKNVEIWANIYDFPSFGLRVYEASETEEEAIRKGKGKDYYLRTAKFIEVKE